ncbi:MAG TPA: pyridoxamine 5'-phosphate oxidase family protein [Steroidobacteraceae bacterium]|nr:pyridoxamine 5'-phosphate oxidase family protein [Steroidobacteraceae bacterium]
MRNQEARGVPAGWAVAASRRRPPGSAKHEGAVGQSVHHKARNLWPQRVKPWFPSELDDPDLGLLEVTVEAAEYWDVPAKRMQRLFARTASREGEPGQPGEHGEVRPASGSPGARPH